MIISWILRCGYPTRKRLLTLTRLNPSRASGLRSFASFYEHGLSRIGGPRRPIPVADKG